MRKYKVTMEACLKIPLTKTVKVYAEDKAHAEDIALTAVDCEPDVTGWEAGASLTYGEDISNGEVSNPEIFETIEGKKKGS